MKYLRLRYVQEVTDRYGKKRYYYRRSGFPRISLQGAPGSKAFLESYMAAANSAPASVRPGKSSVAIGTFADLFSQYYDSVEFRSLQPITQRNYRAILGRLSALDSLMVKDITRADILRIRDKGNTISLIRRLKTVLNFAVERDFRTDNPADKIKIIGERKPFRAWSEDDIITFAKAYPYAGREILALMLLLYTGARRSDVVTFGWHMVAGNTLSFIPRKTSHGQSDPQPLQIPIHPRLLERITMCPIDQPTFLMTEYGKPMSEFGFSNWFSERASRAGLPPQSSPHGLRKAASRRLAEAGCSAHEIASITGHSTLKEVERYTKSSDQAKLARSAIGYLESEEYGPKL